MEARFLPAIVLLTLVVSMGASSRTPNFIVEAPTPELADKIGKQAEKYRRDLAIEWLGAPMPNWSKPCPIVAEVAPHLGAGGATSFVFDRGEVFGWDMKIQGNEQRLLDSVLPHEVTHTIFASHFRQPLPRWADEGACTTVEHIAERTKQQQMLISFLKTQRGIAFHQMFAMKDYPRDVLPLYSQGYSLARFFIEQGGRHKFMAFVGDGLKNENWSETVSKHYGYANLAVLQEKWLAWVKQGSPQLDDGRSGEVLASNTPDTSGNPTYRAQSEDHEPSQPTERAMASSPRQSSAIAASRGTSPNHSWESLSARNNSVQQASSASVFDEPASASVRSAGSAGRVSVYDRRGASTGTPAANASSTAISGLQSVPLEPVQLARNEDADYPSPPSSGRRVLLQWTRAPDDVIRR